MPSKVLDVAHLLDLLNLGHHEVVEVKRVCRASTGFECVWPPSHQWPVARCSTRGDDVAFAQNAIGHPLGVEDVEGVHSSQCRRI